jgi:hypothetical protein
MQLQILKALIIACILAAFDAVLEWSDLVFLSVFLLTYVVLSRRTLNARQNSQQILKTKDERDKAEKEITAKNHIAVVDDDNVEKEITSQQMVEDRESPIPTDEEYSWRRSPENTDYSDDNEGYEDPPYIQNMVRFLTEELKQNPPKYALDEIELLSKDNLNELPADLLV